MSSTVATLRLCGIGGAVRSTARWIEQCTATAAAAAGTGTGTGTEGSLRGGSGSEAARQGSTATTVVGLAAKMRLLQLTQCGEQAFSSEEEEEEEAAMEVVVEETALP